MKRHTVLLIGILMALVLVFAGGALPGVNAAFPGENGKIVFTSLRVGGQHDVYVMNPDGSNQTRLTTYSGHDVDPSWSPDGTKIAFASTRDGGYMYQIFVMNADGSNQTQLTDFGENMNPVWSPDGTKIAFQGAYGDGIYVMNADGSDVMQLTFAEDSDPGWSPDGAKIAFSRCVSGPSCTNIDIFVMDADGGNPVNITNNASLDYQPDWSPDGTKLVYVRRLAGYNTDLFSINADGTGRTRLTYTTGQNHEFQPAWSPDGSMILYSAAISPSLEYEVFVMNSDGSNPTNLTNNAASDYSPDWQPVNAGGQSTTFTPTNDAYVSQAKPKNAFGAKKILQVKDAAKDVNTYIKFNVSGLGGTVQSATLRLWVTNPGPDGGAVYAVSPFYLNTTTQWLETGLKWNNAPVIGGAPLAVVGNAVKGQWVELDVTPAVVAALNGDGRVSLAIANDSRNLVNFSSKEGAHPPELIVITK